MIKTIKSVTYVATCANCRKQEQHQHLADYPHGLAYAVFLDHGWSGLLSEKSYCPECSKKIMRGELHD